MTVLRYIDTAADGTGDGTTRNHTGTTGAYASIVDWHTSEGASLTDDHEVRCAGSTEDTLTSNLQISGFSNLNTWTLSILGDDAATDSDGIYQGTAAFSTSHYRVGGSITQPLIIRDGDAGGGIIIDGIQITTSANSSAVRVISTANGGRGLKVRRCRLYCINGRAAYFPSNTTQSCVEFIGNTVYHGATAADACAFSMNSGHTSDVRTISHNTVYRANLSSGQAGIQLDGGASGATISLRNNVVFPATVADDCFDIDDTTSTITATYNAGAVSGAPTNHDSNWVQISGTFDNEWTDAEHASGPTAVDWTLTGTGALDAAGVAGDSIDPDVNGNNWETTPSIGAFEYPATGSTFNKTSSETLTVTDTSTEKATFSAVSSDTISYTDTATEVATFASAVAETVDFADTSSETATIGETLSESLVFADTSSEVAVFPETSSDSFVITDESVAQVGIFVSVDETITFADTAAETATLGSTVSESLVLTDTSAETASLGVTASESIAFADTGSELAVFLRALVEALVLADEATETTGAAAIEKAVDDALAFTDASSETATFARTVLEALTLSDSAAIATKVIGKLVFEALSLTDEATAEGGVEQALTRGGSSLSRQQMRRLERLQMIQRDDEEIINLIMGILR